MPETPLVVVTAAIIERDGAFLVTRRPAGAHLGGYWEFPGGKCEPGETLDRCLSREILEELQVAVRVGSEILNVSHAYPERVVELHFFECELLGEPLPTFGQEMRWIPRAQLASLTFPPADAELVAMLSTP
jgi:8-oxo-dGTP diphosphatase